MTADYTKLISLTQVDKGNVTSGGSGKGKIPGKA